MTENTTGDLWVDRGVTDNMLLPGESGNGMQNGLDINFRILSRKYRFNNDARVRTKFILEAVKAEVERQSRVDGVCRKLVGPLSDVEGGKH